MIFGSAGAAVVHPLLLDTVCMKEIMKLIFPGFPNQVHVIGTVPVNMQEYFAKAVRGQIGMLLTKHAKARSNLLGEMQSTS
ncbi:MAG: hypothetical protein ACR2IE_06650 [Candidatus Sumerlaeaceae bacterium]